MVQVDVFWSYGLNAGLALAATKMLRKESSFWKNPAFTIALLWTAIIFAPSGIYLLWNNPGWETMFVARNHASIPTWIVTLFSVTNITQGILGFYITYYFIRQGKQKAAIWQTIWSHLGMLFILVFGWDGTGFKRFFYAGTGEEWHTGVEYTITAFFTSEIFFTLLGLGVFFIPSYLWAINYLRKQT